MSVSYENVKNFVDNMNSDLFNKYRQAINERQKTENEILSKQNQAVKKPETPSS